MKKILISVFFLTLSFFINPTISQAAWWNPGTWFNNWSFTAETETMETSEDLYVNDFVDSTPEIKLKPAAPGTKIRTVAPTKAADQPVDKVSNSLLKSSVPSSPAVVPGKVNTAPKTSVVQVGKPSIVSLSKNTAFPGDVVTIYGNNFPVSVANDVSLRNSTRDTGVRGVTSSDGKSIKFTVMDLVQIPAGTYNLSIENSKGDQTNYVPFTIAAKPLICPQGYECQTGETTRVQVASCPIGLICIEKPEVPKAIVCPSGYKCYPNTGTDRIQDAVCPKGILCEKINTQISIQSPSAGSTYDWGEQLKLKWTAYTEDFDHYDLILGNSLAGSEIEISGGISKNQTSYNSFVLWSFVHQFTNQSASEAKKIQNAYYVKVKAVKGNGEIVNIGKSSTFSIIPLDAAAEPDPEPKTEDYCPPELVCTDISQSKIIVTSPNASSYKVYAPLEIRWDKSKSPSTSVMLEIRKKSTNGSLPFIGIYSSAPNTGSYSYQSLPSGLLSDTEMWVIRVTDQNSREIYGESQPFKVISN
ncbi:MAG: hypothetical protein QG640_499 [Patescibacteria group bacterium]|nr:hypothetical protein [Patescibacteria group bacterium]